MSEINFMSTAVQGDIIEIGVEVVKFGKTSLNLNCEVRNKMTHETIVTVDNIIMVNLGEDGKPKAHGKSKEEFVKVDKHADFISYASRAHGIKGGNSTFHLWTKITNYFMDNL